MFGGLKGKLEEAKLKAEAAKAKLDTIEVQGTSGGVVVRVTANREVRAVSISGGNGAGGTSRPPINSNEQRHSGR